MYNKPDIESIQRIVGSVTTEQIRFIDSFIFEDIGIFLPVAGQCFYALTPEHTHPSYMIIYSFKGEGEGWINGIKQTALKPGEFLFMATGVKHQEKERSDTPRYLALCIMPELIEPILDEYNISIATFRSTIKTAKAPKQFLPLCWQFIAELNTMYTPNKSLLRAISVQLCHYIIRGVFEVRRHSGKSDWRVEIGQSIAFIHSHLHDKIVLSDIAGTANMSVPNFCRVFKKELGQTPIDYLNQQRLYKAQNMLLSNEFSMHDIAASCGFSSVSYLSISFKKRYKTSPEKYRLEMK